MMSKDATPVAESVEVTQADREAAESVYSGLSAHLMAHGHKAVRMSPITPDDDELVQSFARHRLASYEAGRAEGVRAAAEVADKVRGGWVNGDATTPYGQAYQAGALEAAIALRALSKEPTK